MQAVFLLAGLGTRMRPLTDTIPKPMAQVAGKALLEHNLEKLPEEVTELIFVIGYLGDLITEHFGSHFGTRPITYVRQHELLGTAHALSLCEPHISGRFLVLMGDDLHSASDIARCLGHEWAWLVHRISGPFSGGLVCSDEYGAVTEVQEGTHEHIEGFMNTNLFVLNKEYFSYPMVSIKNNSEFGLPQTVALVARDIQITMVESHDWQQVTDMNDIARLNKEFSNGQ